MIRSVLPTCWWRRSSGADSVPEHLAAVDKNILGLQSFSQSFSPPSPPIIHPLLAQMTNSRIEDTLHPSMSSNCRCEKMIILGEWELYNCRTTCLSISSQRGSSILFDKVESSYRELVPSPRQLDDRPPHTAWRVKSDVEFEIPPSKRVSRFPF